MNKPHLTPGGRARSEASARELADRLFAEGWAVLIREDRAGTFYLEVWAVPREDDIEAAS